MSKTSSPLRALALSLLPDPFYQAITMDFQGSEEARLNVLERYFEYSLDEAQRTGRSVIAQPPENGGTAWLLPRTPEIQALESKLKAAFMLETLGSIGSKNYHAIVDFMTPLAERHVPANAWYLSIIGVHPSAQGKGLGEELLRPTLQEATDRAVSCYLETFTPRNLRFYNRLGFASVAEYREPTTGASYVIMRRDV
jgi:GNAT superfamily N-acetyltransferase